MDSCQGLFNNCFVNGDLMLGFGEISIHHYYWYHSIYRACRKELEKNGCASARSSRLSWSII